MGEKRAPESARVEEQIVVAWKRYADRKAQGLQRISEGACYLDPRPCPFEPHVVVVGLLSDLDRHAPRSPRRIQLLVRPGRHRSSRRRLDGRRRAPHRERGQENPRFAAHCGRRSL